MRTVGFSIIRIRVQGRIPARYLHVAQKRMESGLKEGKHAHFYVYVMQELIERITKAIVEFPEEVGRIIEADGVAAWSASWPNRIWGG